MMQHRLRFAAAAILAIASGQLDESCHHAADYVAWAKGPRMGKSIEHGSVWRAEDRQDLAGVIYVCSDPPYRAREVGPREVADVEANAG